MHTDIEFLLQALDLAKIRRGFCAPNPSVGAIIVNSQGHILSTGYHMAAGLAHAEVDALSKLCHSREGGNPFRIDSSHSGNETGVTVYVTLEPCTHFGKTPPCTDALIKAGVRRVVYAYQDPNPIVSGKAHSILSAAGIQCDYIPLDEVTKFYQSYRHWQQTKKPSITAKIALSLNGKIAKATGEPIQLTGDALREFTHHARKQSDAILTTAKTIYYDDPQMNVRYQNEIIAKPLYLLDSQLNLPLTAKIFSTAKSITVFHATNAAKERLLRLNEKGVRCIAVDRDDAGLKLEQIISFIGAEGMHDIWVESGGTLFQALLTQNLLQKAFIYIAPVWLQAGKEAFQDSFTFDRQRYQISWQQSGDDVLCKLVTSSFV